MNHLNESRILRALTECALRLREIRAATGLFGKPLYRALESLEAAGLVDRGGTRQIYSLTDAGREQVRRYLLPAPVNETPETQGEPFP